MRLGTSRSARRVVFMLFVLAAGACGGGDGGGDASRVAVEPDAPAAPAAPAGDPEPQPEGEPVAQPSPAPDAQPDPGPVATDPAAPGAERFTVALRLLGEVTEAQEQALARAKARIEEVIVGDLPDVALSLPAQPACGDVAVGERVDDLLVLVRFEAIDGRGGVVGRAGPCVIRDASSLPILGIMHFDSADLADLEAAGQLESVILHEMLHVTGLGTLWSQLGRIAGSGTNDPVFTGPAARSAFLDLDGGATYGGTPVPVESTGGAGTAEGHWRESVFGRELMTGWISGPSQPLSRTSVASLADLGYAVELPSADAFDWSAALRVAPPSDAPDVPVGDDVLRIPLLQVDERGVVTGAREPR